MQNIGGDSRDANYRYKMPVLVTKVEGRGNGIKTVVVNMVDIAKALHIHPAYPTKFFGIELGAQSKFNVATERAIVNGCHQAGDLAKLLEKFIQQFILCPNCRLPELKMTIKSSSIKYECAACGAAGQIKSGHRLIGYMTKNPPKSFEEGKTGDKDEKKKKKDKKKKDGSDDEADDGLDEASAAVVAAASSSAMPAGDDSADGAEKEKEKKPKKTKEEKEAKKARKEAKKAKKAKKEEKKAKKAKKAEKDEKDSSASESSDDEEEEKEEAKEAPSKEKKEKKAAASSSPKDEDDEDAEDDAEDDDDEEDDDEDDDDGDDWHTDTSKAAVKRRAEAEFAEMLNGATRNVESIVLAAKADNKADSPVTVLKIFLASASRSPSEVAAELRRLAMARGLDEAQKIKVLLEALIDTTQPKTVLEQLKKHAKLLQFFTTQTASAASGASSPDARTSNAAVTMLTCIEDLVGVVDRKLLPYTGHILKTLYEEDVLPEETLLAWWDAPPESSWLVNKEVAAEVRAKAAPFIQALREADEEEEEEEDDE